MNEDLKKQTEALPAAQDPDIGRITAEEQGDIYGPYDSIQDLMDALNA